jgi:hypothetical protein
MNDIKYIAELYDYTITKDNYEQGEDPSTTQCIECAVRRIKFNTVQELKDEIACRVLFDSGYRHNMYITHLGFNEYGVDWTSKCDDINEPVDEETMEKFKNGEIDIYAGQMTIYIYKVEPLDEPEGLDFD